VRQSSVRRLQSTAAEALKLGHGPRDVYGQSLIILYRYYAGSHTYILLLLSFIIFFYHRSLQRKRSCGVKTAIMSVTRALIMRRHYYYYYLEFGRLCKTPEIGTYMVFFCIVLFCFWVKVGGCAEGK
jgi:hypothetical protein